MSLIKRTFNFDQDTLPTITEIKTYIAIDEWPSEFNIQSWQETYRIRDEYTKKNFGILSHDFLISIKKMVNNLNLNKIAELCSGAGWFSYWMKKYGIPIGATIDNMSWNSSWDKPNKVQMGDAIEFIKDNDDYDLFILSWPCMDDVAVKIWNKIKIGSYLLYIGEDRGGCTANDDFFEAVEKFEIKDIWGLYKSYISFDSIHDRPILYKKEKK